MIRSVFTVLLWLVATAALTVGIGAGWATVNVQSESGFVKLAGELGTDREVQVSAADLTGQAFVEQVDVPLIFQAQVSRLISNTMVRFTDSAGWQQAWAETVRRTHRGLFAGATPTDVEIDFAPLVGLALDEMTSNLPITLTAPDKLPVVVSKEDPSRLVSSVAQSGTVAVVALGIAAIAAGLALAITRRRSTTVAALGAGAVLAALIWYVAGRRLVPDVIDSRLAVDPAVSKLLSVLSDRVVASLDSWLLPVAAAGAVVFALGVFTRVAKR